MKSKKAEALRSFGDNVRAIRKDRHYSQEKLAALCRLDRTYIGGVERGERNISLLNVCKLARVLGVTPAELMKNVKA